MLLQKKLPSARNDSLDREKRALGTALEGPLVRAGPAVSSGLQMGRSRAQSLRARTLPSGTSRGRISDPCLRVSLQTVVRPTTKAGKARVVNLDTGSVAALRAHKARQVQERLAAGERWADRGLLFTKDDSRLGEDGAPGDALHPEGLTRTLQRRVRAYNAAHPETPLPVIGPHGLRHTWATLALGAGVHPRLCPSGLVTLRWRSRWTRTRTSRRRCSARLRSRLLRCS
jgi:integrase